MPYEVRKKNEPFVNDNSSWIVLIPGLTATRRVNNLFVATYAKLSPVYIHKMKINIKNEA